jgi:glutamate-1-semialdehyde 2,1-aminomutase
MITQKEQYEKAKRVIPGGVNSSTRVNKAIGAPFYVSYGKGSKVTDIEGHQYLDMCCAHGAGLLGNGHPAVDDALRKAMEIGYVNSFETIYHEELASFVCNTVSCADKVRFCSSGSEATMHLIRACRGYTGKEKIIRVEGHFHGYHEMIYIGGQPPLEAFPQNRTRPFIESDGIPAKFADLIIPVPFNDKDALSEAISKYADETALLIMEPINFNCAGIRADDDYVRLVRKLTSENNIILFFDEIQSAYKKSFAAAQNKMAVTPDVTTIGKSIGGGLPLSAFCGKKEIMDCFEPLGRVQHSGTFNAHLIPVLSGLAFMHEASKPEFYNKLNSLGEVLYQKIDKIIGDNNLNMVVPRYGARFNIVLGRRDPARNYEEAFCHDKDTFLKILRELWKKGIYFHDYGGGPSHHGFSIQHSPEDIEYLVNTLAEILPLFKNEINKT